MNQHRTRVSAAIVAASLLALPLAAGATPPPDASSDILVCNGKYLVSLDLDFAEGGVDVSVAASADLNPADGFSPPPEPPRWYSAYVVSSHRDSAHPTWDSHSETVSGNGSYPSQAPIASYWTWIGAGCELKGTATINVGCPGGSSETKTLTRTWVGCGF
ncbi:hypothetical protein [Lysobacter sp. Root983]|uniref:hypothetical protein n=1 Tax=Lysobacter sp. Root983 TaxID=1736613 RepID=UPI00070B7E50|nr:hypothetical protein [Lysobacter sp. Root983]KRD80222.1 hypothetical protein ASE43_04970 [Lysobacter sp. Root983]